MPWLKYFTDESHPKVYLNLINALLEHTSDKEILIRGLYIRTELLKYNFSKRQSSIINFVFGASYLYGKQTALIPRMKDWELCGIQQSKAPGEIQKLVDLQVLTWNKETNEFGLADPRGWEAPANPGWNSTRARELFILNLKHAGINVEEIMEKSLVKGGIF